MMRIAERILIGFGLIGLAIGCGGGADAPKLAAADGTVMYQGKPLAGATVTFLPEKGPIANGVTDLNGKFTLSTGALPGVAVGDVKVSVSAYPPGKSVAGADSGASTDPMANLEKMAKQQEAVNAGENDGQSANKSLIPEKYVQAETSGLTFTVKPGNDNHFTIELKD